MKKRAESFINSEKDNIHKLVDEYLSNFKSKKYQELLKTMGLDTEKMWLSSVVHHVGEKILKGTSICSSKQFIDPLAFILYTQEEIDYRFEVSESLHTEIYSYLKVKKDVKLNYNHGLSFVDVFPKKELNSLQLFF